MGGGNTRDVGNATSEDGLDLIETGDVEAVLESFKIASRRWIRIACIDAGIKVI